MLSITPEVSYLNNNFTVVYPSAAAYKVRSHAVTLPVAVGFTPVKFLTLMAGPNFTLYDNAKREDLATGKKDNLGKVRSCGLSSGGSVSTSRGSTSRGAIMGALEAVRQILVISAIHYSLSLGFKL